MAKRPARDLKPTSKPAAVVPSDPGLLTDLRALIESARLRTAQAVNAEFVLLYWQIGKRIREDILQEERAAYGEQIVIALSSQLQVDYGRGFSRPNLFRTIRFAEVFPDEAIVSSLMRQLSWTHLIYIIALDDPSNRRREPDHPKFMRGRRARRSLQVSPRSW